MLIRFSHNSHRAKQRHKHKQSRNARAGGVITRVGPGLNPQHTCAWYAREAVGGSQHGPHPICLNIITQFETRTKESYMCATFSGVSRDTDQEIETSVQVCLKSDPSGTEGTVGSVGRQLQFLSLQYGPRSPTRFHKFIFPRESLDMYLTDNRP